MRIVSQNGEISAATYKSSVAWLRNISGRERPDIRLQPTALLHEAFLCVLKHPDYAWTEEGHVIAFAARAMRRILISYGRRANVLKRGGPSTVRLPLDEVLDSFSNATSTSQQWMRHWRNSKCRSTTGANR